MDIKRSQSRRIRPRTRGPGRIGGRSVTGPGLSLAFNALLLTSGCLMIIIALEDVAVPVASAAGSQAAWTAWLVEQVNRAGYKLPARYGDPTSSPGRSDRPGSIEVVY
jgi:hypothetical protein